ncbi:MAG: hypothetical protein WC869_11705 [Phycisphaerae bacterium]|jgi:hypothetical protein
MNEQVDSGVLVALKGLIGPVLGVTLGMLWDLADDVRAGRPFTRRVLAANVMTAAGLGLVVAGFGEWLSLPPLALMAVGAVFGKLGTDWLLLNVLPRLIDKYLPRNDDKGK